MLDLLASTAALLVVLALLALVGIGLTVLPFVVAADLAERRGLSVPRAGTLTLVAVGVALAGVVLVLRGDRPSMLALLPLLLTWLVPGALLLLRGPGRVGGRRGLHE